jgi:hypothetical protein
MKGGVVRILSHVFMATENITEYSTVLHCDLYSVLMKLVQSEIPRSRDTNRGFERLEIGLRTRQQGEIHHRDSIAEVLPRND